MTRKQKIFRALYRKHAEAILAFIYTNSGISFEDICKKFNKVSKATVRRICNLLSTCGLIKSIYTSGRHRQYVIADESTTIYLLELEV